MLSQLTRSTSGTGVSVAGDIGSAVQPACCASACAPKHDKPLVPTKHKKAIRASRSLSFRFASIFSFSLSLVNMRGNRIDLFASRREASPSETRAPAAYVLHFAHSHFARDRAYPPLCRQKRTLWKRTSASRGLIFQYFFGGSSCTQVR